MNHKLLFILILPILGLGCINVKTSVSTEGGVWQSSDAGETWASTSLIPTEDGVASFGSADISVITFDAADDDAVYAGTTEKGLLFSYDNGASWQRPGDAKVLEGRVYGVAVDPRNKCTIYTAIGSRVMKSTDCNRTYDTETFVEANGKAIRAIELDWYSPDMVWTVTAGGDVMKSINGGDSWTTVTRVGDNVMDMMIDNADSRIVIVATEDDGVWRTVDGGATWSELADAIDDYRSAEVGYALAQNSDGSMMYYASKYGLLRSTDHGATWTGLTLLTAAGSVRIYSLAVDPNDGNVVYYGTNNTFYSTTDGGDNWATNLLPTDRAATVITIDPDDSSTIFLGVARVEKD
ncbi:MAG: hypothetical protein AAB337_03550 [Patescibacteria group bacterium]